MKMFLLVLAILSPLQTSLAVASSAGASSTSQRPLAAAIRQGLESRPLDASQVRFLLDRGVTELVLNDFIPISAKEMPLKDVELNARTIVTSPSGRRVDVPNEGRKIVVELADPKSGEIMSFETDFTFAKEGSPESMYERYTEHVTKRPTVKEFIHSFPMQAMVFYYGLGLSSILSLVTRAESDPLVFDRYVKSLVDPVAQASFFAFIVGNHMGSYAMNSLLFNSIFSKNLSPKAKMRISKMLIPHLGMAVGGMSSNAMHDLVTLVKGCSDRIFSGAGADEQTKAVCSEAYKSVFANENAYRYATAALSMISSGFLMMVGQGSLNKVASVLGKVGGAVSRKAKLTNLVLKLSSVAGAVPLPQGKLVMALRSAAGAFSRTTKGAIHLVAFLEIDQRIFHPYFHHKIARNYSIGPKFQEIQKELLTRLSATSAKKLKESRHHPATPEAQRTFDQAMQESLRNSGTVRALFEEVQPLDIPWATTTENVTDITFGKEEVHHPLHWLHKGFNWSPLGLASWAYNKKNVYTDNLIQSYDFSQLLEEHYKVTETWRMELKAPMLNQYNAWLEVVAPFNASTQVTYDLYYDFIDLAMGAKANAKARADINEAHLLADHHILNNIPMRRANGEIIPEGEASVLSLAYQDMYRYNSVRMSMCYVEAIDKINEARMPNNPSVSYGDFNHAQRLAIKSSIHIIRDNLSYKQDEVICNQQNITLKSDVDYHKELDYKKINKGLARLQWLISRYPAESQLFTIHMPTSESNNAAATQEYNILNLMEHLTHYLGTNITPYERGERFIAEWDKLIKENQSQYYSHIDKNSPAAKILQHMICPVDPNKPMIDQSFISNAIKKVTFGGIPNLTGKMIFTPPALVATPNYELCNKALRPILANTNYYMYNLSENPALGELIDYAIDNLKIEVAGEPPSTVKSWVGSIAKSASNTFLGNLFGDLNSYVNGSPNRFLEWWDTNIENQISQKFNEITVKYGKGVHQNITENFAKFNGQLDMNKLPDAINESYLMQMNLYMDFILMVYRSLQRDTRQVELAFALKDDILKNLNLQMLEYVGLSEQDLANKKYTDLSTNQDGLINRYAETLILLKRFKGLLQGPEMNAKSPFANMQDPNAMKVLAMAAYMTSVFTPEALNGRQANISSEFLNAIDLRISTDNNINEAVLRQLEDVSKPYQALKPVYFTKQIKGNGLHSIKELYNYIAEISENIYQLSKMTRLTTTSSYLELDQAGKERRPRGSIRAIK